MKDYLIQSNIKNLGLCFTKITENEFKEFSQYFKGNQKLKELDLSGHNCNIPTILKSTLFSSENNLTSLNLSNNNLNENDFQIISDLLLKFPKIQKLNISNNIINQKGCNFLGSALNKSTSLEDINLSSCGITGETIVLLINKSGSKNLKNVILDNNNIEDFGLIMISQFIKNSINLNSISLKNVSGSDIGFNPIISTILLSKSPIKEIYLERNQLISYKNKDVKKINSFFLPINTTLKCLSVPNAEDFGMCTLQSNKVLEVLDAPNVKVINSASFYENEAMSELCLESVERIGINVFRKNKRLKKFYAPNVGKIGKGFLKENTELQDVYCPALQEGLGDDNFSCGDGLNDEKTFKK